MVQERRCCCSIPYHFQTRKEPPFPAALACARTCCWCTYCNPCGLCYTGWGTVMNSRELQKSPEAVSEVRNGFFTYVSSS